MAGITHVLSIIEVSDILWTIRVFRLLANVTGRLLRTLFHFVSAGGGTLLSWLRGPLAILEGRFV